ncbi:MAG: hypothetical protein ACXACG_15195 [Candidatus Thorarchaeota archaeon]
MSIEAWIAIGLVLTGVLIISIIRLTAREFSRKYVWVYGSIIFFFVGPLAGLLLSGYISFDNPAEGMLQLGLAASVIAFLLFFMICGRRRFTIVEEHDTFVLEPRTEPR